MQATISRTLLMIGSTLLCFAAAGATAAPEAAKPRLVKIHADWCGTCVRLNPTWEALRERHGDTVEFVILDVTNDQTKAAAHATASERGLVEVLETYGSRTGTILVIGPAGGKPLAVLKGESDVGAYNEPIERARASEPPGSA